MKRVSIEWFRTMDLDLYGRCEILMEKVFEGINRNCTKISVSLTHDKSPLFALHFGGSMNSRPRTLTRWKILGRNWSMFCLGDSRDLAQDRKKCATLTKNSRRNYNKAMSKFMKNDKISYVNYGYR